MSRFVPSRSRSPLLLVVMAVVVGVLASACGRPLPYAAKVNGEVLGLDVVEDELAQIAANERYLEAIEAAQVQVRGTGQGTFHAGFAAQVLTRAVAYELIRQELEARDLQITDADRQAARQVVIQQVQGEEVFEAFSAAYQRSLIERVAGFELLSADLAEAPSGPDAARTYYEEHPEEFEETCLAHILSETEAQGADVLARLQAGADFAQLAEAESVDQGSGAVGGELGCATREVLPPPLDEVIFTAPVGEYTGPVESALGWHVFRIDDRRLPPFEEVEQIAQNRVDQSSGQALNDWITEALAAAEVEVNPRFGEWSTGFSPQVVPPLVPTTVARGDSGGPATGLPFEPPIEVDPGAGGAEAGI